MKLILPQLSDSAVWIWRAIYIPGIVFEISQVIDRDEGDTLSELLVYRFAQSWVFHGAFAGFVVWAAIHWRLFDDPNKGMALTGAWWLLGFVAVGVAIRRFI